jgi:hypothetical protein
VAREVWRVLGPASGAVVQDINTQLRVTLSGLTALDLSGLTRLELAFAFLLAAAASGLALALGLVERRRPAGCARLSVVDAVPQGAAKRDQAGSRRPRVPGGQARRRVRHRWKLSASR